MLVRHEMLFSGSSTISDNDNLFSQSKDFDNDQKKDRNIFKLYSNKAS